MNDGDDAENAGAWQRRFNEHVLQQRVQEEVDRKERFDALEQREREDAERRRAAALASELDRISARFAGAARLRDAGPELLLRCAVPFGVALLLHELPAVDMTAVLGCHGFIGFWRVTSSGAQMLDFEDVGRELSAGSAPDPDGDVASVVCASCVCHDPASGAPAGAAMAFARQMAGDQDSNNIDATRTAQLLMFCASPSGRGSLSLLTLSRDPLLPPADAQDARLAKLFRADPAAALRASKTNADSEGPRWVRCAQVLADRHMTSAPLSSASFASATSTIVAASGTFVRGFDLHLHGLWTCDVAPLARSVAIAQRDDGAAPTVTPLQDDGPEPPRRKPMSRAQSTPVEAADLEALDLRELVLGAGPQRPEHAAPATATDGGVQTLAPLDERGSGFLIGTAAGDIFVLAPPVPSRSAAQPASAAAASAAPATLQQSPPSSVSSKSRRHSTISPLLSADPVSSDGAAAAALAALANANANARPAEAWLETIKRCRAAAARRGTQARGAGSSVHSRESDGSGKSPRARRALLLSVVSASGPSASFAVRRPAAATTPSAASVSSSSSTKSTSAAVAGSASAFLHDTEQGARLGFVARVSGAVTALSAAGCPPGEADFGTVCGRAGRVRCVANEIRAQEFAWPRADDTQSAHELASAPPLVSAVLRVPGPRGTALACGANGEVRVMNKRGRAVGAARVASEARQTSAKLLSVPSSASVHFAVLGDGEITLWRIGHEP